jgi:hypothetical protein
MAWKAGRRVPSRSRALRSKLREFREFRIKFT